MRGARLLVIASLIAMASCKPAGPAGFAGYADAVTLSPTENTLRYAVDVTFTAPCNWRILYWKKADGRASGQWTAARHTDGGKERVVLKFLYPETEYEFTVVPGADFSAESEVMGFKTGALPVDCPVYTVEKDGETGLKGYLMQWEANPSGYVTFCDIDGKVVWYEAFGEAIRVAWCDPSHNRIAVMTGFQDEDMQRLCAHTVVTDLDGNRILYWTSGKGNIEYPHHEIKILEDGNLLYVNNVLRDFPIGTVWGDGFTVISPEGNKVKEWDCFGELGDLSAPYLKADKRLTDLVHANSVARDSDGNWYMTFNALSELWKIDGQSGDVIYRVGVNGNVTLSSGGDFPQGGLHAATPLSPDRVLCYANGRNIKRSSAVIYKVDASAKTAVCELTIPLPEEYSSTDRSNAQLLEDEGIMLLSSTTSRKAVFTDLEGNILRVIGREAISYRAYWFNTFEY